LRYTTRHLNDETTPKAIRSLLAVWRRSWNQPHLFSFGFKMHCGRAPSLWLDLGNRRRKNARHRAFQNFALGSQSHAVFA
jgi:hypothetical protein